MPYQNGTALYIFRINSYIFNTANTCAARVVWSNIEKPIFVLDPTQNIYLYIYI